MFADQLCTFVAGLREGNKESPIFKLNPINISGLIQSITEKEKRASGRNGDSLFIYWQISEQSKWLSWFNQDLHGCSLPIQHDRGRMGRPGIMELSVLAIQNAIDQRNEHA